MGTTLLMESVSEERAPQDAEVMLRTPARILVIDDYPAMLDIFRRILSPELPQDLPDFAAALAGKEQQPPPKSRWPAFDVVTAADGQIGERLVEEAQRLGRPFAAAFVDMRMPGWDGLQTIEVLWRHDPDLQIVVCTAYNDYGWDQLAARLGRSDRWLVLRKPFEMVEVMQMASALTEKWWLLRERRQRQSYLEQQIDSRLGELKRANRTLRMLSRCCDTLVRAENEQALLETICNHIIEDGGYALAWVGYARKDAGRAIEPVAYAGIDDGYLDFLQLTWADTARGRCPAGQAIREQRPVASRYICTDPGFEFWREEALKRGFASVLALPLRGKQDVLGNLSIYSAVPDAFDEEEVALLAELADNLAFGILSLRETTARQRAERELAYQTHYDLVTGLPNRSLFLDRLQQAKVYAERADRLVAVLLINLDRFKVIKAGLDPDADTLLLDTVGKRLQRCVRGGDTVARLGADEFAIAMTDIAKVDDIAPIAGKLLAAVAQPITIGAQQVYCTASIGISVFPKDGGEVDGLVHNADAALRRAKAGGGNAFRFYAPDMNQRASARLALEADLYRALQADEFSLYFQPKVSLATGVVVGAEALIRWQHPQQGLVMPGGFIPQAEESGLILALGEWVTARVCRQIRDWLDTGMEVPPIAVNVSPRQFRQANLAATVRRALEQARLDAGLLELEITESALMEDMAQASSVLEELKSIGVKLTLDDFGTGYSSLSYLQRFPIDHVKIDQSFVSGITTSPQDAAICQSVIGLAHSLQLRVIGEGVETAGQMQYLRRHRCDDIQGYYCCRPVPANEFADLLRRDAVLPLPERDGCDERTLLIVDDDPQTLAALRRLFARESYQVLCAPSGAAALELLALNKVQVILSDQRMPEMNGTEFLARVRELYPDTIRIILSGHAELNTVIDAVNRGTLFKFLTKPWDSDALRIQVQEAFLYYELRAGANYCA